MTELHKSDIRCVRVDVPDASGQVRYFYIYDDYRNKEHPWWGEIFDYLIDQKRQSAAKTLDGVAMDICVLSKKSRSCFLQLLRTAPDEVVAGHRTLRSALKLLPQHDLDIPVRYFGRL